MAPSLEEQRSAGDHHGASSRSIAALKAKELLMTGQLTMEPEAIAQLRSLLPPSERDVSDQTLQMYVNATNGDLQLSAKRLSATLEWRRQTKPETVVCKACCKNPRSHYMHVIGYDLKMRPIIYTCNNLNNDDDFKDTCDHMIQTFEMAIRAMPEGVTQWVWVADCKGFGVTDVSPKLTKAFLHMSATYYPERLAMFMLIDTPKVFSKLWDAVEKLVDPKTYMKIKFVPFDLDKGELASKLHGVLSEYFDPDTVEWLQEEMKENRDKAMVKSKVYDYRAMYQSAVSGQLATQLANMPPFGAIHDIRGTRNMIATYVSTPSLLEPQGSANPGR